MIFFQTAFVLICISLLIFLLKKPGRAKKVLAKGQYSSIFLDTVEIYIKPKWENRRHDNALWLDGFLSWQDWPMDDYSSRLDKMVKQDLGFADIHVGHNRVEEWLKSYTKSGKRYQYLIKVQYEKEPEEQLTVSLERLYRLM